MSVKTDKARENRFRRPALAMIRRDAIIDEIGEIGDACAELEYTVEDDDKMIDVFEGDSDELKEFRMMFSDLSYKCERLTRELCDAYITEYFDDFFVGMLGRTYKTYGYDVCEEDYFNLTQYEAEFAQELSQKRIMGLTKENILAVTRQCIGIMMCMLDIRNSYDCLKSTLDILRDDRAEIMKSVKHVSDAYNEYHDNLHDKAKRDLFFALLERVPDAAWVQ